MNQDEIDRLMTELSTWGNARPYLLAAQLHTERDDARERVMELERQVADLEAALAEGQEVWAEARRVGPQHLDYTPIPRGQQMYEMEKRRRAFEKMQRAFAEDYDDTDE